MTKGPFEVGQRVRVHWAGDNSMLEGGLVKALFEGTDDLAMTWGNQFVHFWDGAAGTMTYIYGLEDVTIEIIADAPLFPGPAEWRFPEDNQNWYSSENGTPARWSEQGVPDGSIWQTVQGGLFGIGLFMPFPLFPAETAPAANMSLEFDIKIGSNPLGAQAAISLMWMDYTNPEGVSSDPIMVDRDAQWHHVDFGPIFTWPQLASVPHVPIIFCMPGFATGASGPIFIDNVRLYDKDTGWTIVLPAQPQIAQSERWWPEEIPLERKMNMARQLEPLLEIGEEVLP
jgi:hypothetical protein